MAGTAVRKRMAGGLAALLLSGFLLLPCLTPAAAQPASSAPAVQAAGETPQPAHSGWLFDEWVILLDAAVVGLFALYLFRREKSRSAEAVKALHQREDKLAETEASLRAAMSHSGMNVWEYYPETHTATESREIQMQFGVPELMEDYPESWIKKGITYQEDVPILRDMYRRIDEGAKEASSTIRALLPDGAIIWESVRLTSLYDQRGKRRKVLGTAVDISEQHRALERYRGQMAQIQRDLPNAVVSYHLDLTDNLCSPVGSRYPDLLEGLDGTVDTLMARMADRAVTPQQREEFARKYNRQTLLEAYNRGDDCLDCNRCCRIGGRNRWVAVRFSIKKNPATGHVEVMAYSYDIDEQCATDQIVGHIIHNNYLKICRIDIEANVGRIFSVENRGEPSREVAGIQEYLWDLIRRHYADEDLEAFLQKNDFSGVALRLEHVSVDVMYGDWRGENGEIQRVELSYSWLDRESGVLCFCLKDMTAAFEQERRRSEELQTALTEARVASRAKSDFLSRMSHEIRTPMNAILTLSHLVEERVTHEDVREDLNKIISSGEYLLGLINDILDMSRIESGHIQLHPEDTNVQGFFQSILNIIQPLMDQRNIHFRMDATGAGTQWVQIDKMRMQQIYINILNNAVKFSAPGSEIECSVRHQELENDMIRSTIVFRDHGCGMSEEFLGRVFDPFEQERNLYSDTQPGTGLGMAIVKNLVDAMGGEITVKSRLGEGTEFTLCLTVPKGHPQEQSPDSGLEASRLKNRRVLLAEDHPINTEIARKLLEKQGMLVEHAENGCQAVEMFTSHDSDYYDVVLMDIRMPQMDGIEATRQIRACGREDAKTVPIIAMTANALEEDRKRTLEAGMVAHLTKPIRAEVLYALLQKTIRSR